MDYSTTIPINTTNATIAVWDCSGKRSISSQELWVKIGEGGAPFIGKMSVPFILFFLMVVIYIDEVIFLVKNSIYWKRTVYAIWVLSLFPVLTAFSITGIFAPRTSGTARFAASFYFAVVLKKFFTYILHYYGGKEAMVEALRGVPYVPPNPFPCCFVLCCWRNHPMTVRRLNVLQGLVYQVLIMYPLIYLLQSILALEYYTMPNRAVVLVSTILGLLGTLSSFTCLYGYTVLSKVSRFTLQNYNIRAKFITVQMVVAFNTVQGFTIRTVDRFDGLSCGFPYPDKANSYLLHNYILICEVFILSLCAWWAFRRNEEGCEVQPVLLPGETFTSIKKDIESATTSDGTGSCDKDSIPTDDVSDDVPLPYGGLHMNKAFESV
ncbi:organic solute transporter subunit alpha-like [Ciona intestinalis]